MVEKLIIKKYFEIRQFYLIPLKIFVLILYENLLLLHIDTPHLVPCSLAFGLNSNALISRVLSTLQVAPVGAGRSEFLVESII